MKPVHLRQKKPNHLPGEWEYIYRQVIAVFPSIEFFIRFLDFNIDHNSGGFVTKT